MSKITINIDDATIAALDGRARVHGRTAEEEARQVLAAALAEPEPDNMAKRLGDRFAAVGGAELLIPPRGAAKDPVFTFWEDKDLPV